MVSDVRHFKNRIALFLKPVEDPARRGTLTPVADPVWSKAEAGKPKITIMGYKNSRPGSKL